MERLMSDDKVRLTAVVLLAEIKDWSDEEREHLFSLLGTEYCHSCGRRHPKYGFCECWNDE
jgi:hypothetical protein